MRNKAFDNIIKALCLVIALAMLIGLTACGSGSDASSYGTGNQNGNASGSDTNSIGSASDTNTSGNQTGNSNADSAGIESILEFNDGPKLTIKTADAEYVLKKGLKAYLFIGIDDPRTTAEQEAYNIFHLCDTLLLFVVDDSNNTYSMLPINRNTVTTVDVLDGYGNIIAQNEEQLSFAYAYSMDAHKNSENVVRAVSRMLGSVTIDAYVTLGYSAIPLINDAVDGVTVTIEDDFSQADASLVKGETITLSGDQALHFVRYRMNVGEGDNAARMRRQQMYINAFKTQAKAKMAESSAIINEVYNVASPYLTTNMSSGTLLNTAARCLNYSSKTYSLSGKNEIVTYGSGYTHEAFAAEKQSVDSTVLELFYEKIQ